MAASASGGANARKNPFVYLKADYLDEAAMDAINSIAPRPAFDLDKNMWIIPREEAKRNPALRIMPWQELEVGEKEYNAKLVINTAGQIGDRSSRVYLDFSDDRLVKLSNDPRNRGKIAYDPEVRRFFVPAAESYHKFFADIITRYSRKQAVTADQLVQKGEKPSNGMIQLAAALNINDPGKRIKAVAELIPQLLTEKYEKMPGSIRRWEDILLNPAFAAQHSISFSERCRYCDMFKLSSKTVGEAVKAYGKTRDEASFRTAMAVARQENLGCAGRFLKQHFEHRMKMAAAIADPSASVSLARSVVMDYCEGTALQAGASMFLKPSPGYPHNVAAFSEMTRRIAESFPAPSGPGDAAGLEWKARRFGEMLELSGRSCERLNRLTAAGANMRSMGFAEKFQQIQIQISNNSYYLNEEMNDHDIRSRLPCGRMEEIPVLDGRLEPLFLAVPEDEQRRFFEENRDAVKVDPQFGHICVADTPENRRRFSARLPKIDPAQKLPPSHEELAGKAREALRRNGYSVEREIKADGRWHSDPKDPSKRYVVNLDSGVPRMSMVDLNGSLKQSLILASAGERKPWTIDEKRAYAQQMARSAASARALDDQAKARRAGEVRGIVESLAAPSRKDHPYAGAKQLSLADFAGVKYDADGKAAAALLMAGGDSRRFSDSIIAPLVNIDGKIVDAQIMTQEKIKLGSSEPKQKFYAKGAPASGAMFVVGGYGRLKTAKSILVAEGIATAATIQKYSPPGTVVVAAMSCGNLASVARALSDRFPHAGLHIMGDNDVRSAGVDRANAGIAAAFASASDLSKSRPHISASVPPFTPEELRRGLSDFNDAMCRHSFDTDARYAERVHATVSRIQDAVNASCMQHAIHVDAAEATLHQMSAMEQQEQLLKARIHDQYEKFRNEKPVSSSYDQALESAGMRM